MADPLKHLVDASVSTWLDDCRACDWSPTRSTRLRRPGQTAAAVWVASFEEVIQVITTGNVRDPCDVLPVPIQQLPSALRGEEKIRVGLAENRESIGVIVGAYESPVPAHPSA